VVKKNYAIHAGMALEKKLRIMQRRHPSLLGHENCCFYYDLFWNVNSNYFDYESFYSMKITLELRIIDGQDEFKIKQADDLPDPLSCMIGLQQRIILLVSQYNGKLTVGLGKPFGFVEHMDNKGNPP
jgi:hypothetical protein